jgi:predicted RNA-binding protein
VTIDKIKSGLINYSLLQKNKEIVAAVKSIGLKNEKIYR